MKKIDVTQTHIPATRTAAFFLPLRVYNRADIQSTGGGAVVFVTDNFLYLNPAERRAENFKFKTCLNKTDLEIEYLFHTEFARKN